MPVFTSARERRLWLWALVVLVTIYVTLGLAGALAEALRERGVLDLSSLTAVFFVLGALLIAASVMMVGFSTRPSAAEIGVGLGILAIYVLVFVRLASPVERSHLMEYGVLGVLIYLALLERRSNGRNVPMPALIAVAATGLLGWLDEGIQWVMPSRVYDVVDVGVNVMAAIMAVAATTTLIWARNRRRARRERQRATNADSV